MPASRQSPGAVVALVSLLCSARFVSSAAERLKAPDTVLSASSSMAAQDGPAPAHLLALGLPSSRKAAAAAGCQLSRCQALLPALSTCKWPVDAEACCRRLEMFQAKGCFCLDYGGQGTGTEDMVAFWGELRNSCPGLSTDDPLCPDQHDQTLQNPGLGKQTLQDPTRIQPGGPSNAAASAQGQDHKQQQPGVQQRPAVSALQQPQEQEQAARWQLRGARVVSQRAIVDNGSETQGGNQELAVVTIQEETWTGSGPHVQTRTAQMTTAGGAEVLVAELMGGLAGARPVLAGRDGSRRDIIRYRLRVLAWTEVQPRIGLLRAAELTAAVVLPLCLLFLLLAQLYRASLSSEWWPISHSAALREWRAYRRQSRPTLARSLSSGSLSSKAPGAKLASRSGGSREECMGNV